MRSGTISNLRLTAPWPSLTPDATSIVALSAAGSRCRLPDRSPSPPTCGWAGCGPPIPRCSVTRDTGDVVSVVGEHVEAVDAAPQREVATQSPLRGRRAGQGPHRRRPSRGSVVRYDAFGDMGGRLSFSAALLDDHGDGVVISARSTAAPRAAAMPRACQGRLRAPVDLSPEEQEAVRVSRSDGVRRAADPPPRHFRVNVL